jgi:hypothetical protein
MPPGGSADPSAPAPPSRSWYTTNFIKRLTGRPGESLMVLDGDVYVSSTGGTALHDFKVQRKPRDVQDALWRIICDGEFAARTERWQPWHVESSSSSSSSSSAASGWNLGDPEHQSRVYRFQSEASGTIAFDQNFNNGRAFTDSLAYAPVESGKDHVSDVKLSFLYRRISGNGALRLRLSKLNDTFTAELTPGGAKLYRKHGQPDGDDDVGQEVTSNAQVAALSRSGPVQVEFMNADYQVTLRVGGVDVLQALYEPDIDRLKAASDADRRLPKPQVRITAAAQQAELSHVSLWRDVYYTNRDWRYRGPLRNATPDSPVQLGPDEYFVMGDNTVISADARYWGTAINLPAEDLEAPAGRVPRRFMLGKAFFVYWPAGYRPLGSPSLPGLIPNFGDMRFIH